MFPSGTLIVSTLVTNCIVSLSTSVAVMSLSGTPVASTLTVAVPLFASGSSAAAKVTGWSEFQFTVVKVRAPPDCTDILLSPLTLETVTFTSAEG